jgi:hypothetical protein
VALHPDGPNRWIRIRSSAVPVLTTRPGITPEPPAKQEGWGVAEPDEGVDLATQKTLDSDLDQKSQSPW